MQIHSVSSECEDGSIEVGVRLKGGYAGPGYLCITRLQFIKYDRANHEQTLQIETEMLLDLKPTLELLGVDTFTLTTQERARYSGSGEYRLHAWQEKRFRP